jgi:hypothetical protein
MDVTTLHGRDDAMPLCNALRGLTFQRRVPR